MILVMSGTKDGREITNLLQSKGYEVYTTTATEYSSFIEGFTGDGISKPLDIDGLMRIIKATMIYTHVLSKGGHGVRSPIDGP